jgi:fructose 1,6-bisphosphatase
MIEISSLRVLAFTAIAGALLKGGQAQQEQAQQQQEERALAVLSEAARAAEEIEWANDRALALVEVALKYYEAGREAEVARLLLEALESATQIANKLDLSAALARLSDAYHETGVETDDRVAEILREIVLKLD